MYDTTARGPRATHPAGPEAPARRALVDVMTPVRLSDGSWLMPGETLSLPVRDDERVIIARCATVAIDELRALVGGALVARDASPPRLQLVRGGA
jgi:hypothetical protein